MKGYLFLDEWDDHDPPRQTAINPMNEVVTLTDSNEIIRFDDLGDVTYADEDMIHAALNHPLNAYHGSKGAL